MESPQVKKRNYTNAGKECGSGASTVLQQDGKTTEAGEFPSVANGRKVTSRSRSGLSPMVIRTS